MYNFDPYNVLLAISICYDCFCAAGTRVNCVVSAGLTLLVTQRRRC